MPRLAAPMLLLALVAAWEISGCSSGGGQGAAASTSTAPVANAGADTAAEIGADVTLSGVQSRDPRGLPLSFSWVQTAGTAVSVQGSSTPTATVSFGEPGSYGFQLTVSNGESSATDTVTVSATAISGRYLVDIYKKDKVSAGTTLFGDTRDQPGTKFVEVDMRGQVTWEYAVPASIDTGIGLDVKTLATGNLLFNTGAGVFEIDRAGNIVWQYLDNKASHDCQRLPDGSTIYVFGNNDTPSDDQVKRVTAGGAPVWQWRAADHIPLDGVSDQGWTHTNAVVWENDESIFINLRNQNRTVQVNSSGSIIWDMDWTRFGSTVAPHEPDLIGTGNLLICLQVDSPSVVVEIDRATRSTVWSYENSRLRTTRDANRLPNGNTLIVSVDNGGTANDVSQTDDFSTMMEVTQAKEIVWRMTLASKAVGQAPGYFFKAQRIPAP